MRLIRNKATDLNMPWATHDGPAKDIATVFIRYEKGTDSLSSIYLSVYYK